MHLEQLHFTYPCHALPCARHALDTTSLPCLHITERDRNGLCGTVSACCLNTELLLVPVTGLAHWTLLVKEKHVARAQKVLALQWRLVHLHADVFSAWRFYAHKLQVYLSAVAFWTTHPALYM